MPVPWCKRTIAGTTTLGTLALTGANAALLVTAGTVSVTSITTTNANATVTLNGGTLSMNGGTIGGTTAISNLNFQSGTLQNVSQINNGGAISKTTAGTLILAGTNSYTGPTNVNNGTLAVNENDIAAVGLVTVNGGATFGGRLLGNGTVGGHVVVTGGTVPGEIRAGNFAIGTLNLNNRLDVNAGSRMTFEIADDSTSAAAGTGLSTVNAASNNLLNISGGLSIIDNGALINVVVTGGTFSGYLTPYNFKVAQGAGNQSTLNINTIINPSQFTFTGAPFSFASLTGDAGGAIYLNFTTAPEPSAFLGLAASGYGLARLRRKARSIQ